MQNVSKYVQANGCKKVNMHNGSQNQANMTMPITMAPSSITINGCYPASYYVTTFASPLIMKLNQAALQAQMKHINEVNEKENLGGFRHDDSVSSDQNSDNIAAPHKAQMSEAAYPKEISNQSNINNAQTLNNTTSQTSESVREFAQVSESNHEISSDVSNSGTSNASINDVTNNREVTASDISRLKESQIFNDSTAVSDSMYSEKEILNQSNTNNAQTLNNTTSQTSETVRESAHVSNNKEVNSSDVNNTHVAQMSNLSTKEAVSQSISDKEILNNTQTFNNSQMSDFNKEFTNVITNNNNTTETIREISQISSNSSAQNSDLVKEGFSEKEISNTTAQPAQDIHSLNQERNSQFASSDNHAYNQQMTKDLNGNYQAIAQEEQYNPNDARLTAQDKAQSVYSDNFVRQHSAEKLESEKFYDKMRSNPVYADNFERESAANKEPEKLSEQFKEQAVYADKFDRSESAQAHQASQNSQNASGQAFDNNSAIKNSSIEKLSNNNNSSAERTMVQANPIKNELTLPKELVAVLEKMVEGKAQNAEKSKIELTDQYVKNLESYLNSQDKKLRLMAAKDVVERLQEDENRRENPALIALTNKMLQDPNIAVRSLSLAALESNVVAGDTFTTKLLNAMAKSKNGEESDIATKILLRMP